MEIVFRLLTSFSKFTNLLKKISEMLDEKSVDHVFMEGCGKRRAKSTDAKYFFCFFYYLFVCLFVFFNLEQHQ
jgi:hypothetical protein